MDNGGHHSIIWRQKLAMNRPILQPMIGTIAAPGRRTHNHVSRCAELAAPAPGGRSSKNEKIEVMNFSDIKFGLLTRVRRGVVFE
eukprot:COSAG06_NODE_16769_length_981_cov_6.354875_2_plen_85_part_00